MHVGVKITVPQRMLEEELQHPVAQGHPVMPGRVNRRVVPHRDAIGPFQRHDPAGRIFPFDVRQLQTFVRLGVRGEFGSRGAFKAQVQLTPDDTVEMLDHLHRAQPARPGREKLHHSRGEVEGIDILAKGPFDIGPQHLYGHLLPRFGNACPVHLRDGGRRHRLRKFREHGFERQAKLLLHLGLRQIDGKGRKLVLQHTELHGEFVAHNVGTGGKHLPELDVGRAQRRQRAGRGRHGRIARITEKLKRAA